MSHEKYNESHIFTAQRGSKVEEMRNVAKCNLAENESHRQLDNFTKVRRKFGALWECLGLVSMISVFMLMKYVTTQWQFGNVTDCEWHTLKMQMNFYHEK